MIMSKYHTLTKYKRGTIYHENDKKKVNARGLTCNIHAAMNNTPWTRMIIVLDNHVMSYWTTRLGQTYMSCWVEKTLI